MKSLLVTVMKCKTKAMEEAETLIIRVAEFKGSLHRQIWLVCYAKARSIIRGTQDTEMWVELWADVA